MLTPAEIILRKNIVSSKRPMTEEELSRLSDEERKKLSDVDKYGMGAADWMKLRTGVKDSAFWVSRVESTKFAKNPPVVKPKGGKRYLAIPANPIAASWDGMPRDFPGGLRFAFSKTPDGHWLPSLIAASNYKHRVKKTGRETKKFDGTGNAGQNEIVYWLVHKMKSRHDPSAMPMQRVQTNAATAAVRTAVQRLLAR